MQTIYLRGETTVPGELSCALAERFLSDLLFANTRPTALHTKRPGMGAKLNMGEFTIGRWKTALKKVQDGKYAVLHIKAETPDFPNQKIWLTIHVNPPGGNEFVGSPTIEVKCSLSYLRHLAAAPDKVEALIQLGKLAWDGGRGGAAYGYGNIAIGLYRPVFDPRVPGPPGALPWEFIKPPAERVHAVPVAYVGNDIEGNLSGAYVRDRGIKGAFWANYLTDTYVAMAGGEQQIRGNLAGIRVESLNGGGLLVVATDNPFPEDTEDTRRRFLAIYHALRPAFLARNERSDLQKPMLSYFYREREDPFGP